MITKRAKLPITLENVIENNKILEISKKKEYTSKATQNCTKRASNSKLIKDLKRIAKRSTEDLIKELNKDLLAI